MSGTTFPTGISTITPTRSSTVLADNGTINGIATLSAILGLTAPGDLLQAGATTGQGIVWNGSSWAPGSVAGGSVSSVAGRTGAVTLSIGDITGAAPLASPALTGTPTVPTATPGTNTQQAASTAFVAAAVSGITSGVSTFNGRTGTVVTISSDVTNALGFTPANSASPALTGTPTAPTAAPGTNTQQVATTAFVAASVAASTTGVSAFNSRTGNITLSNTDVTNALGFTPYNSSNPSNFATLGSPSFTGTPLVPTATPGTNTTQAASTAFVAAAVSASTAGVASFNGRTGTVVQLSADVTTALGFTPAPVASPTFTGTPAAPTAAPGTSTTQIATTAFATAMLAAGNAANVSGTVAIANGGTGATTAANARTNLGLATVANTGAYADLTGRPGVATTSVVGLVKAGSGLAVDGAGTLTATGVPTIDVDQNYAASGAIDTTKNFVTLTSATSLAMTLANASGVRQPMYIKNEGSAQCTVVATIDGTASTTVTLLPKATYVLVYSAALSSWQVVGQFDPGTLLSALPAATTVVNTQKVLLINSDGTYVISTLGALSVGLADPKVTLTQAATVNTDPAALQSTYFALTINQTMTLANPTNLVVGQSYRWDLDQDSTGGRALTLGSLFKFPGGAPTLATTASSKSTLFATYDGSILRCSYAGAFG